VGVRVHVGDARARGLLGVPDGGEARMASGGGGEARVGRGGREKSCCG
jgi:hypothetical protein